MAKNPNRPISPTKKHIARLEREKKQIRWIIFSTVVIAVAVVSIVVIGFLYESWIKPNRTVAIVNGEKISGKNFTSLAKFQRASLIQNAIQTYNFAQYFGNDPNTLMSIANQIQQINTQLDTNFVGQSVIDSMIEDLLIRQEANRRGITVNEEEINKLFQSELGYFPEGTPTTEPTIVLPPTSTLNPFQKTVTAPTATAIITETLVPSLTPTNTPTVTEPLTPTATLAPSPTPTAYTEEGYKQQYKTVINNWEQYGVSENTLRNILSSRRLREKVKEAVLSEIYIPFIQEQVWARHILVADEQTAKEIKTRLLNGEDFCKLASELSTDTSNKYDCGNLGWFPKGQMVSAFEEAAFAMKEGEISEPVQTENGFHIIWVLGHENRSITQSEYEQAKEEKFTEWLSNLREASDIKIFDVWTQLSPSEPSMPLEIQQFVQQTLASSIQPTPNNEITIPETTPVETSQPTMTP